MAVALVDPGPFVPELGHELASGLARSGLSVELLTAPFVHGVLPSPDRYARLELFGRALGGPWRAIATRSRTVRRLLRGLAAAGDWRRLERHVVGSGATGVHLLWPLLPRLDARALGRLRRRGVRVAVSVHNPERRPGDPPRAARLEPLFAAADVLVAHGGAAARALAARVGATVEVREVPLAAARFAIEPPSERSEARRRLGLAAGDRLALFFGRLRPYKGLETLLAAFERAAPDLPSARLLVAGPPGMPIGRLVRHAARGTLAGRVRFEPRYLEPREADELFAAADLVVLPYLAASQSAVLARALGYARPVIASDVAGLAEMVRDGVTGRLVPPGDVGALAEALVGLLGDPTRLDAFGAAAERLALASFSAERQRAALVALHGEALATP